MQLEKVTKSLHRFNPIIYSLLLHTALLKCEAIEACVLKQIDKGHDQTTSLFSIFTTNQRSIRQSRSFHYPVEHCLSRPRLNARSDALIFYAFFDPASRTSNQYTMENKESSSRYYSLHMLSIFFPDLQAQSLQICQQILFCSYFRTICSFSFSHFRLVNFGLILVSHLSRAILQHW